MASLEGAQWDDNKRLKTLSGTYASQAPNALDIQSAHSKWNIGAEGH